jgi:Fe-S-cluster containining protein
MADLPKIPRPPTVEGPAGARRRLAQILQVLRAIDPPGAFAAIAEESSFVEAILEYPGPSPDACWEGLVGRLQALAFADGCLRCGYCCRRSSPTLYSDDLDLVTSGRLDRRALFTLRAGEAVRSARKDETFVLDRDLVKLRERPQGGCLNLDDHLCRHYDARPLQCRNLECWSGRHGGDLEDRARLSRRDLYADDAVARQLMDEYDVALPAAVLRESLLAAVGGDGDAAVAALAFIERDHRLRAAIASRYGYSPNEQELLFGRDALAVVHGHGLVLNLEDEDRPFFVSR